MKLITAVLFAATCSLSLPALAVDFVPDSVSIEGGASDSSPTVGMWRVGVQWEAFKWFEGRSWTLVNYIDLSIGSWHAEDAGGSHDIGDIGLTPTLRLQKNGFGNFIPYAEIGIGFHGLTSTNITQHRQFSTNFQFGDHVGAGLRFGEGSKYDLSYRYQHLSNLSIESPNPGINFHQLRLQYHF
ncbi:MAG: acyloxyacyl hydrolase [Methylophilaceae bacterium]|nr:acyloxyacyl hydrolase [Methylophilaceae bacterium]